MKTALDSINSELQTKIPSMSVNFVADGSVLVYEYSLPDKDTYNNMIKAAFGLFAAKQNAIKQ